MSHEHIENLLQRGLIDDAMVECKSVLQVVPTNARVLGLLGMCHFRKQDYATALDFFRRATLLDPKFVDAGLKHAQCLDKMQRYEEAFNVASEWLHVQPSNRALQCLVEAMRPYARGTRQGWERTATLNTTVRLAGEE